MSFFDSLFLSYNNKTVMECVECYITFTFMCIYDLITPLPKVMTMKCVVNEVFFPIVY